MTKQELLNAIKGDTCSIFELTSAIKDREQEEFECLVSQLEFNEDGMFDMDVTGTSVNMLCETDAGGYVIVVSGIYKDEDTDTWILQGYEDDFCSIYEIACGHLSYLNEAMEEYINNKIEIKQITDDEFFEGVGERGTCFQHMTINTSRSKLFKAIGKVRRTGTIHDKSQYDWYLMVTVNGKKYFANIYDYKRYCMIRKDDIIEWHVGSNTSEGARLAKELIDKLL